MAIVLVALVGWLDDQGHVAARWRLLAHFAAAIWGLVWLGGFPPLLPAGQVVDLSWLGPELFWGWGILLGVFVVDATLTLLRRLLRRERVYEAHRSHAYQHAARHHGSHIPISLTVAAINLLWLLPLAILVVLGHLNGPAGILLAWTPLVILALYYQAGCE